MKAWGPYKLYYRYVTYYTAGNFLTNVNDIINNCTLLTENYYIPLYEVQSNLSNIDNNILVNLPSGNIGFEEPIPNTSSYNPLEINYPIVNGNYFTTDSFAALTNDNFKFIDNPYKSFNFPWTNNTGRFYNDVRVLNHIQIFFSGFDENLKIDGYFNGRENTTPPGDWIQIYILIDDTNFVKTYIDYDGEVYDGYTINNTSTYFRLYGFQPQYGACFNIKCGNYYGRSTVILSDINNSSSITYRFWAQTLIQPSLNLVGEPHDYTPPPEYPEPYEQQEKSTFGGGTGDYTATNDDTHDNILMPNQNVHQFNHWSGDTQVVTNGMAGYILNDNNFRYLFDALTKFDLGQDYLTNLKQHIIAIKRLPYTPGTLQSTSPLRYGGGQYTIDADETSDTQVDPVSTSVIGYPITQLYTKLYLGSFTLNEYWGSFLDYPPYTTYKLFLPFYGFVDLDANVLMNKTVYIYYNINNFTSSCNVELYYKDEDDEYDIYHLINNYVIQDISENTPWSAENYTNYYNAIIQTLGTLTSLGVSGFANMVLDKFIPLSPTWETKTVEVDKPVNNIPTNTKGNFEDSKDFESWFMNDQTTKDLYNYDTIVHHKRHVNISDLTVNRLINSMSGLSVNAFMSNVNTPTQALFSQRKPFIIRCRPDISMPENYAHHYGIPSNVYCSLGELEGFTAVKDIQFTNMTCSEQEKNKIDSLLKGGIII